jgi:hypothetical protein
MNLSMEKLEPRLREFGLKETRIADCLADLAEERNIKRDSTLVKPGRPHDRVYFIKSGLIKITDPSGPKPVISWMLKEGDLLTAPDSFISGNPTRYEIKTLEHSVVMTITKEQLYGVGRTYCELFETINAITDKYRLDRDLRENDFKHWSPQERFDWFMSEHGNLYLRVPGKDLATYLELDEKTLWECKKGIYNKGKEGNKQ